eukprot:scaffold316796_cov71-Attheya_sp.AAC.1
MVSLLERARENDFEFGEIICDQHMDMKYTPYLLFLRLNDLRLPSRYPQLYTLHLLTLVKYFLLLKNDQFDLQIQDVRDEIEDKQGTMNPSVANLHGIVPFCDQFNMVHLIKKWIMELMNDSKTVQASYAS